MDVEPSNDVSTFVNTSLACGSAVGTGNSSSDSFQKPHMQSAELCLKLILPPILILMATCGNVTGLLVVNGSVRLNQISASIYLRVYFVVSTLVLFLGTGQTWICVLTGSPFIWNATDYACRLWEFGSGVIFYYPIWLLVAFATDRWLLVSRSRHAYLVDSVFAAKVVCLAILSGLVTVSVHAMWTFELLPHGQCGITADSDDLHSVIWPWISVTMYSFLPLALLFVYSVRLLLLKRSLPRCCQSTASRQRGAFNLHIEVLSSELPGSGKIESGDEIVPIEDVVLTEPYIKPMENHSAGQILGHNKSVCPERTITQVGEVSSIRGHLAVNCCNTSACSGEVSKPCLWEDKPLSYDTVLSYPSLEESNSSSGILSTTAIYTALICFVCTVPATVVNVYSMQVPAQSVFHQNDVNQLRFLFAVFQMLPVMSHAVMPVIGYMTSDLVKEETSAFFRKSTDKGSPNARKRDSSAQEDIKVTSV